MLAFDSLPIHPEPCPDWGGADGDNSLGNGEFSETPQCEGGRLHLFFSFSSICKKTSALVFKARGWWH